MAFKQCQKLLKVHFCELILPSEKGLPGGSKTAKTQELREASPPRPHQGKQKNKQKAKKSVPEEPSKWVFKRLKSMSFGGLKRVVYREWTRIANRGCEVLVSRKKVFYFLTSNAILFLDEILLRAGVTFCGENMPKFLFRGESLLWHILKTTGHMCVHIVKMSSP